MFGGDTNPDGDFSDVQAADTVNGANINDVETISHFLDDLFRFDQAQRFVCFILELQNDFAIVEVAHPTFECAKRAGATVRERATELSGVDFFFANLEQLAPCHRRNEYDFVVVVYFSVPTGETVVDGYLQPVGAEREIIFALQLGEQL